MPKNHNTIARQAKAAGMTKRDFLADLNSRHTKITSMAAELGVTHIAVTRAMAAGIEHKHARHFEYCGIVDCATNHAKRHGVPAWRVFRLRDKHGISVDKALDLAVLDHIWPANCPKVTSAVA